jgi:hypothetical protein
MYNSGSWLQEIEEGSLVTENQPTKEREREIKVQL